MSSSLKVLTITSCCLDSAFDTMLCLQLFQSAGNVLQLGVVYIYIYLCVVDLQTPFFCWVNATEYCKARPRILPVSDGFLVVYALVISSQ